MNNFNLDWMEEVVESFNKLPKTRKNLIEIAGYPSWENVNSNLLAFYLDVENNNDEHGFSKLFIISLIDLLHKKLGSKFNRDLFLEDSFTVEREVATKSNKKIDILIQASSNNLGENEIPDWAIIIENKIYAELYNDLCEYWDHVKSKNKVGVILSLTESDDIKKIISNLPDHVSFCNITHKEFVEYVSKNLPEYYLDSNDRHLLFLKEYMANINSHYKNKEVDMANDKVLKKFHENNENIKNFFKVDRELSQHVCNSLFETMKKFGFPPVSESYSKAKHFEFDENTNADYLKHCNDDHKKTLKKFRFWFEIDSLKYDSEVYAWFELFGEDDPVYGEKLVKKLEELDKYTNSVMKNNAGSMGRYSQCIYELKFKIDDYLDHPNGFKGKLEDELSKHFFNHTNDFIKNAILELTTIIKNDNSKSE